jgi:hypothetical protein
MKENVPQNLQGWAKTRSKGMARFVIVIGGIWGIVTTVITQLLDMGEKNFSQAFMSSEFLIKLAINIGVGILVFAPVFWFLAERKYKKMQENQ